MTWIVIGVAWGLLCVGTRHFTIHVGRNVQELVAVRHERLTRVQVLDRRVAEARQLGNLEKLAAGLGLVKPRASQLIIVAPEEGLLSRIFGGASSGNGRGSSGSGGGEIRIRSRDEVIVEEPAKRRSKKSRRRRRGSRSGMSEIKGGG